LSAGSRRDRDSARLAADRDRRTGSVSGSRDRGHRTRGLVDDVGRLAVRRDRDGVRIPADCDRRAGSAGGGRDRGHRVRDVVGDVSGLAIRGDRDVLRRLPRVRCNRLSTPTALSLVCGPSSARRSRKRSVASERSRDCGHVSKKPRGRPPSS